MTSLVVGVSVSDDIAKQHFSHRNLRHDRLQLRNKEPHIQYSVTFHDDDNSKKMNEQQGHFMRASNKGF